MAKTRKKFYQMQNSAPNQNAAPFEEKTPFGGTSTFRGALFGTQTKQDFSNNI